MRTAEKRLLNVIKMVAKDRTVDYGLPGRCISLYHQPKRPQRLKNY
ncbi:MAG: hypothetical protein IKS48_11545 [Eubacterium sp.]|nr:hypothetical protein [Clostridiales bacterium]MBR6404008.1 hypothetical protein [Eubacterium sp.]